MPVNLKSIFCASLFVAFQCVTSLQAGIFWGHPYQDRHFNYNSTPRYSSAGYSGSQTAFMRVNSSNMEMNAGIDTPHSGLSSGAMVSAQRPAMNAILRVWVPDGLAVEVNGYPTKPQSLAGIHSNSRVFSLEGLDVDRVSPCDIVIHCVDQLGNSVPYRRALSVSGGGNYEVRFPRDFEPMVEHDTLFESSPFVQSSELLGLDGVEVQGSAVKNDSFPAASAFPAMPAGQAMPAMPTSSAVPAIPALSISNGESTTKFPFEPYVPTSPPTSGINAFEVIVGKPAHPIDSNFPLPAK